MTEAEWVTTKLPLYMLGRESPVAWDERKARLFWTATLRGAWGQLTDDRLRRLVANVEDDPTDAGGRAAAELAAIRADFLARKPEHPFPQYHRDGWGARRAVDLTVRVADGVRPGTG